MLIPVDHGTKLTPQLVFQLPNDHLREEANSTNQILSNRDSADFYRDENCFICGEEGNLIKQNMKVNFNTFLLLNLLKSVKS